MHPGPPGFLLTVYTEGVMSQDNLQGGTTAPAAPQLTGPAPLVHVDTGMGSGDRLPLGWLQVGGAPCDHLT